MRWFSFILLAYLMLGIQSGLGGIAQVGGAPINFVLIAVTFIAVNAQRDPALIACFVLGLLHDLLGSGPIGMYSLAYCCVALMVAGTDHALAVEHPITHFFVTLFGGLIVVVIVKTITWWHGVSIPLWPALLGIFYTALVGLPVLWVLSKLRKSFKFRTSVGR